MSRHENSEDDLGGYDELTDRQRAVVARYQALSGRYQRDRRQLSTNEQWADFTRSADADEKDRFYHS